MHEERIRVLAVLRNHANVRQCVQDYKSVHSDAPKKQDDISAEGYDVHPVFQTQQEDLLLKTVPEASGSNPPLSSELNQSQRSDQKPKLDESRDSVFPPQHSSATQEFVLWSLDNVQKQ